jgi:hypothetical protein
MDAPLLVRTWQLRTVSSLPHLVATTGKAAWWREVDSDDLGIETLKRFKLESQFFRRQADVDGVELSSRYLIRLVPGMGTRWPGARLGRRHCAGLSVNLPVLAPQ